MKTFFLTVGQIISALSCVGAVAVSLYGLVFTLVILESSKQESVVFPCLFIASGVMGFFYNAALFIVFGEAMEQKRLRREQFNQKYEMAVAERHRLGIPDQPPPL
jgi:hypothetical protein